MKSFWFALVMLLPAACATPAKAPPAERPPVIDMHVHAEHSTSSQTWEGLLSDLDTYNVIHVMLSVEDTAAVRWHHAMPDRFWVGPSFPLSTPV